MTKALKKVPAAFYQLPSGKEPVRVWLKSLPEPDRLAVEEDIATVEYGWPLGMPLCRSLGAGLWEIRSSLPSKNIARIIFCTAKGKLVLLHGFIKRTPKTPLDDLVLAKKRKKEIE